MAADLERSTHHIVDFGVSGALRTCKQFLNSLSERAVVAADRSRFASLPPRYLEDIGMTGGDRVAILGFDEPAIDPWRVVASHL